jgi:hypothetical protein
MNEVVVDELYIVNYNKTSGGINGSSFIIIKYAKVVVLLDGPSSLMADPVLSHYSQGHTF